MVSYSNFIIFSTLVSPSANSNQNLHTRRWLDCFEVDYFNSCFSLQVIESHRINHHLHFFCIINKSEHMFPRLAWVIKNRRSKILALLINLYIILESTNIHKILLGRILFIKPPLSIVFVSIPSLYFLLLFSLNLLYQRSFYLFHQSISLFYKI